jgi:histidinol-phosphatase (PHP family)
MYLADYHSHSTFSSDGNDSFAAMLDAARKAGLNELCVTDHCDMSEEKPFPAVGRYSEYARLNAENKSGCKLLLGIELGEPIHDLAKADASVNAAPYDFIIGSHHALKGEEDFYRLRFDSEDGLHRLMPRYFAELHEMAEWGKIDVLGHIDYPLRYTGRDGFTVSSLLPRYEDELRGLFGVLADKGIGLEVNVGKEVPDPALYALYRRCGGEIITVGSDAHRASDVGRRVKDGTELCRAAGFEYISLFEQRRVRFEKI